MRAVRRIYENVYARRVARIAVRDASPRLKIQRIFLCTAIRTGRISRARSGMIAAHEVQFIVIRRTAVEGKPGVRSVRSRAR